MILFWVIERESTALPELLANLCRRLTARHATILQGVQLLKTVEERTTLTVLNTAAGTLKMTDMIEFRLSSMKTVAMRFETKL